MSLVERTASQTLAHHGSDPWKVAGALGVGVFRDRLPVPHREIYFSLDTGQSGIIVAADAGRREAQELIAHGLAHHLLHAGNRISDLNGAIWSGRNEREAEDFAACLLVPEQQLRWELDVLDQPSMEEVADKFGVSEGLLRRRLSLLRRRVSARLDVT
jgi:Zn-dependent peptidase ImmA (M78 family)